ncbi:MAG: hypothetical protein OES18_15685 [Deltaproteobacteria bacterium]|nr:hypothetical protein [Deltaproteobacteria bacterium]
MAVLPGVLGPRYPATYFSSTPRVRAPAVAGWHAHLHSLATTIHETSGLGRKHRVIGFKQQAPTPPASPQ